jgi:hypothetical protein
MLDVRIGAHSEVMAYESSLLFDSVVLIESLDAKSEPTGTKLFENTIAPALVGQNMLGELYQVPSRPAFFGALKNVLQMTRDGHAPILHLEAHGDTEGLELASGEHVKWAELAPVLTEINIGCQMNLLVVAAACEGWYLGTVLRPVDRSPIWGVLGPPEVAKAGNLYLAMTNFYRELLESFSLRSALLRMNEQLEISEWRYQFSSAEILFCRVFRYYMQDLKSGETHEQRVNRLVAEIARVKNLDVVQTMKLRAEIAADMSNHKWWFDYYRTGFLMLDLFPNNLTRFKFSFEDCTRRAA